MSKISHKIDKVLLDICSGGQILLGLGAVLTTTVSVTQTGVFVERVLSPSTRW